MEKFTHLKSIIRPRTKFHFASLIVKRKPRDVYFTCRFKYTRRHVKARTIISNNNVRRICTIKSLVGTINRTKEKEENEMKNNKENSFSGINFSI